MPTSSYRITNDWLAMPLFVLAFASLLLFGATAATLVAVAITLAHDVLDRARSGWTWRTLLRIATVIGGLQAGAWAYHVFGGTTGSFVWPWSAMPVAAAVAGYCLVMSASADVLLPVCAKRSIERSWPTNLLQRCQVYFIAGGLAAALAEVIARRSWQLLPAAAVPVYLAYRVYRAYETRLEHDDRHREVIDALADGMCVVDRSGQVTLWNDVLDRMVDRSPAQAVGRSLTVALPLLADTDLPRAIDEALTTRSPRTLPRVRLRVATGPRVLQVAIRPMTDAVVLLWQDVTEPANAEHALKREVERLALAAEGASDGLWAWDLRTGELYVTGRWKAMLGLPATADIVSPEQWHDRVHADDVAAFKTAVEAYLSDDTDCFEHEHRIRHEDGTYRSFHCRGVAEKRSGRRPTRIAGSLSDVTDQALTQERLRNAVYLDPLTGLCNRAIFVDGLGRRLKEFQRRRSGDRFALLYLDLDRFKVVNDSLGHLVGDELLIAVSRRLETCLREGDVLARLGGDEFAILLNGLQTDQQANVVAFRVQEALSKPFSIGGREVFTSASIGIAYGLAQYGSPDEIMHDADTAMYQAKARGKARHEVFDADMDARVRDRLGLENDLRHAVDSNDVEVHYQPIVSLASGMCVGFESLVRWTRNGTPVSPAIFIPIAEELGLIETLGMQVLQQACRTFADWQRRFPRAGLDYITVNVSSRQLMQDNFLNIAEQAVRDSGLRPRDLRIEITETALMTSPNDAAQVLSDLRKFGARIYLDDFGTGYSSLSHLHKLPVDALKIDRSFVRSLDLPDRPAIVESILALARTLNTSVVAEGIETEVQARELERLGCTHAQGFLFSRPLSTQAVEEMLTANRPLGPKGVEPSAAVDLADGLEPYGAHSLAGFFSR